MLAVAPVGPTYPPTSAGEHESLVERAQSAAASVARAVKRTPGAGVVAESLFAEQRSGAPLLAGGLAYRLFFWIVAFGLFAASLLSFWVRSSPGDVESTARSFGLAGVAAHSATTAVEDGSHARWYLLASGLFLLLYFGIGAVRALHVTSLIAWRMDPIRLRRPLRKSVAFTGLAFALLAASLGGQWLREHAPAIGLLGIALGGAAAFGFALVGFSWLPRPAETSWQALWPGAAEVAIGFVGTQALVTYYLAGRLERSPNLYGTLGGATVVLLWLFIFGRLLVSGTFLNATIARRRNRGDDG
jgi:uncharacterized BrkB/YihY/UPF0761 family membrane protein